MSLGEKLRNIRKKFGMSQENLANIINVSRQAITKWESDLGLPDPENLKALSHVFGLTIDFLLDNSSNMPLLKMRLELDKNKYKNGLNYYEEVLYEYYKAPWKIYILTREKKMNKIEKTIDFFIDSMPISLLDLVSDFSPYYLVKKDNLKLLVNIKNNILEVYELNSLINEEKFSFDKNIFTKRQELILDTKNK